MTVESASHGARSPDPLRPLRAAAWANAFVHVLGLMLAAAWMRPGTPAAPLLDRMVYLAARPLGWTAGWLVWIACAVALVGFMVLLARDLPSLWTRRAAALALAGAILDITCDVVFVWVLPARATGSVSEFVAFERRLNTVSLTGANGLYTLAVLLATFALPRLWTTARALGILTFASGVLLGAAGLTGDPRHVMAGTALTIPFFLAWTWAVSSRRPR